MSEDGELAQVRREEAHFEHLREQADEKKHEGLNHLVRKELELEQFECEKCGRMVYINKMDLDALRQKKGEDALIIPDCPFDCWSETKHRRTLKVEVKEVKEVLDASKVCAECGEPFDASQGCKEIYIKELKKPDDIIEVHKTLENIFGE